MTKISVINPNESTPTLVSDVTPKIMVKLDQNQNITQIDNNITLVTETGIGGGTTPNVIDGGSFHEDTLFLNTNEDNIVLCKYKGNKWKNLDLCISGGIENIRDIT